MVNLQIFSLDLVTDNAIVVNQDDAQKLRLSSESALQITSPSSTTVANKVIISKKLVIFLMIRLLFFSI